MAKKVTVISTSIRPNSNSELLAKSFAEGAEAAGNEVTFITLKDKDIRFCRGCLSCHQTGKCIIQDDVAPIMDAVLQADVVVWATPIYYFEMSGQMKTLIDRMNPMYPKDYRFRDVYFLATAAARFPGVPSWRRPGRWERKYRKKVVKSCFGGGGTERGPRPPSSSFWFSTFCMARDAGWFACPYTYPWPCAGYP